MSQPGRKRRNPEGADGTTVYLTPEDQVALNLIRAKRKKADVDSEDRSGVSQVLVDGIWELLQKELRLNRKQIEALLEGKIDFKDKPSEG